MRRFAVLMSMMLLAPVASAVTDGWEILTEVQFRSWDSATLQWASTIHPESPTPTELQNTVDPPPREMWCPSADNWAEDCDAWEAHMDLWLHHFLDIPYADPLPTSMAPFPKECPSSCSSAF
jgi:hypothetical protein